MITFITATADRFGRSGRPALLSIVAAVALAVAKPAAAVSIGDSDGVVHHLDGPVRRIISLYPAHTENLVELGAADRLIGISTADTYPEQILDRPRFSYHDSLEKFIAADPDCILIRPMISRATPNLVGKLRDYGITVISLQPTTVPAMYSYWRTLGLLCGAEVEAELMIARFQDRLARIDAAVSQVEPAERPRVYFESIHRRMRTFSPDSIAIFCLTAAGGVNVAADAAARHGTNIASYGKERILARAADIDVFLAQHGRMNRVSVADIVSEPGFGAIKAIRENRVHLVDEHLVSRPTSRLIEGIQRIHRILYNPATATDRAS